MESVLRVWAGAQIWTIWTQESSDEYVIALPLSYADLIYQLVQV